MALAASQGLALSLFLGIGWSLGALRWHFHLQVKKLVYVYLVRYAEEQQDLALLSISTFQRGLKVGWSEDSGEVWRSTEPPTAALQPPACPHRTPTS